MNHDKIAQLAADVYKACDIREFPINCMAVLEHYGLRAINIETLREKSPELYSLCLTYAEDSLLFRERKLIIYRDVYRCRTRFSLMHELGHYLLKHCYNAPEDEYEANYFASCMLAPRPAVQRLGWPDIRNVSSYFDISREAARVVIDDFYHWWHIRHDAQLTDWEEELMKQLYSTASCPTLCERANIEWMVHQKVCRSPWPLTPVEDCPDYPMPI